MEKDLSYCRFSQPIKVENKIEILKLKLLKEKWFLIKNLEPLTAVWRGDNESSMFYAWISSMNNDLIDAKSLENMSFLLKDKLQENQNIEEIIKPLLQIVENGWYQVFYHTYCSSEEVVNEFQNTLKFSPQLDFKLSNENLFSDRKSCIWLDNTIVFTQNVNALDAKVVEFYKESIINGKKPIIVTLGIAQLEFMNHNSFFEENTITQQALLALEYGSENIYPQFIIDGHHKAKAYMDLNIKPNIINLTKLHFKEEQLLNNWNHKLIIDKIEKQIKEKIDNH